jgi:hypothetical protein
MSGFDSRRYQIFWEVVGLEWGPQLRSYLEETVAARLHFQSQRINQRMKPLEALNKHTSALQKTETRSSETSIEFQRTTRRYIPGDRTLLNLWETLLTCYHVLEHKVIIKINPRRICTWECFSFSSQQML